MDTSQSTRGYAIAPKDKVVRITIKNVKIEKVELNICDDKVKCIITPNDDEILFITTKLANLLMDWRFPKLSYSNAKMYHAHEDYTTTDTQVVFRPADTMVSSHRRPIYNIVMDMSHRTIQGIFDLTLVTNLETETTGFTLIGYTIRHILPKEIHERNTE